MKQTTNYSLDEEISSPRIIPQKSTTHLPEQSTRNLSVEVLNELEPPGNPEDSKDNSWVILVAVLPIVGGLIFLIGIAVWYNRRKVAKVRLHRKRRDSFLIKLIVLSRSTFH